MNLAASGFEDPDFKSVVFVIPVRNDAKRLKGCLESLSRLQAPAIRKEIIVIDNGSSDDSVKVATLMGAKVRSMPDLSVAELRNYGASCSVSDLIAFVDSDHILAVGWLKSGLDAMLEPRAGIAGALCHIPPESTWVQHAYDRFRRHPASRTEVTWLGSGNLLIRRNLFVELHGFDESLETCEDVDLCQRARKKGWRVIAEPGMASIHLGDPATLGSLFSGELWRGRDNWRVTLKGPITLTALTSLAVPILNLISMVSIFLGVVLAFHFRVIGLLLVCLGTCTILGLVVVRALLMSIRDMKFDSLVENMAVASVYNLARAIAIVIKASHKTRRGRAC